jgi:hypothetical protein
MVYPFASLRLPGSSTGRAASSGVGRVCGHIQRRQRDQRHAHVRPAPRPVDDAGGRHDLAARLADRLDAFARRQAGGDDVLDHDNALARLDRKAAPQLELAALAFDVERADLQMPRGLIAWDDPAYGR